MNKILDSTRFVVEHSTSVKINKERIVEFSKGFEHGAKNHWLSQAPFDFSHLNKDEKFKFLLIFNALSFSYWGEPKWTIEYDGKYFDGAWGMIVALGRGIKEGFPLLDFGYCSKIDKSDFGKILRASVKIPLFDERLRILQEIGAVMVNRYHNNPNSLLAISKGDAIKLLDVIVMNFPSFNDYSLYKDKEIYFYKRAQLLVSDISQVLKAGLSFKNINKLTACADYKLPQILRKFGILSYAPRLAQKIDAKIEVPHNSEEEIEIRANTIWAVEFVKEQVRKRNQNISSMDINDHLWLATQEKFPDDKPYHRTRTTSY